LYGLLNLHKPAGWTSHDCVGKLRRLLGTKKIGHGGTLDPAATGVLPIAVGKATRLLQYLPTDKAYIGKARLGVTTSTDDLEGDVLREVDASGVTRAQLDALLSQFLGQITQIPPRYSAIQVDGKRLYDLAREGQEFEVPSREVTVHSLEVLGWEPGEGFIDVELAIACGPGTYIRSIARDLGELLGVGGTLASLIRTKSCGLDLVDSLTLEELEAQLADETFALLNPEQVLGHIDAIALSPDLVRRWNFGQRLPMKREPSPQPLRVTNEAGALLGIGELKLGEQGITILSPKLVLNGEG